jgi:DNA polymerase
MRWTERQRAMLDAMGVRLWSAGAQDAAVAQLDEAEERYPTPATAHVALAREAPPVALLSDVPRVASDAMLLAPSGPVAQLDWPALREAVAACTACTLCSTRRQTVFGVGNLRAHWMIVGEAPGEQEDVQGEPFVGKSGQLLDNMLRALGLTRGEADAARQVYIANTLKCRPPGNRNPEPGELERCEPFLVRQIQLVQPRIILAMGRFAVQRLLRTEDPVGRLRGRVHRYQGVPLIVTYHPAYLLRNPEEKAKAWDDLCLARATATAAA